MIRRINFTKRVTIPKSKVEITVLDSENQGIPSFNAELDLSDLDIPSDGRIVISSYHRSSGMRFDWGTVENPVPPDDTRLTETPSGPKFRVMVLSPDGSGRIYAMCDKITPVRGDDGVKSLLWLEEVDNLGQEVWRLDLGDGNPVLKVNRSVADISRDARNNGVFRALVVPEVLRSVIKHALQNEQADIDDESGDWADWMLFLTQYNIGALPTNNTDTDEEELARWIDDWVAAFVDDRLRARDIYLTSRG